MTNTLRKLGYKWDLLLKDELNNTYEISLSKDGRTFDITSASSGEKEIINFILGTFALNVRNGLVVVDEPELHLHPKWQRMLYGVFEDLHHATGNQFVLATHSPAFVTADTLGSLKRVARIGGQSAVIPLDATSLGNHRELLQMINSHNNEKLFFADKIILVEGIHDRLVFGKILDELLKTPNIAAPELAKPSTTSVSESPKSPGIGATQAAEIIEVLEVFGKGNFKKYRDLLDSIHVPSFIVADRDYADEVGTPEVKKLFVDNLPKVAGNTLFNTKSEDRVALAQAFHNAVRVQRLERSRKVVDLHRNSSTWFKERSRTGENRRRLPRFYRKKRSDRIYILSVGAIEEYLPEGWANLDRTIELVSAPDFDAKMQSKSKAYNELKEICWSIISFNESQAVAELAAASS